MKLFSVLLSFALLGGTALVSAAPVSITLPSETGTYKPGPGAELAQVRGARATPSVDRLIGVADGGHGGAGEELGEQVGLHDRGVLVFVEQHHPESRAQLLDGGGTSAHRVQGEHHLIGEVDRAAHPLGPGR